MAPDASYRQPSDGRQALLRWRLHSVKHVGSGAAKLNARREQRWEQR
jgi:hypothetical protein